MQSNWPTALSTSQSTRSLHSQESTPVEEETTSEDGALREFVESKTATISEKVRTLQIAYNDYVEAEQDVKKSLLEQKQRVLDNGCFDHINEIMNDMDAYSRKLESLMKRMDSVFDRVEQLKQQAEETRTIVNTVPPGKPIPPVTKKIQGSVNSMMEKAKSSMDSAKSGDMKEKLADSMSTLGEKMSSMMDKAKNTVQGFRS
ncbi:hypothetical protein WA556_006447 [Blastocystis sp. ATCC 50177/Nand II]